MRYNKFWVKGIFTAVFAFAFVLTACDTSTPTPEELAANLAAEVNAIKAGCAAADGAAVKFTGTAGFFGLDRNLVIPEGVTLDLTADNASFGLGEGGRGLPLNVTLTVNGTVITRSNNLRFEDNEREATINGHGTIRHEGGGGTLISVQGNKNMDRQKLTLDGVTLVGTEDNNEPLVWVGSGGRLVMKSGAIIGGGNGAVAVEAAEEGTLHDNPYLFEGGIFTMEGGTISGNKGGVRIFGGGKGNGTFTMNSPAVAGASGSIKNNIRDDIAQNVVNDGGTVNGSANPNPENKTGILW